MQIVNEKAGKNLVIFIASIFLISFWILWSAFFSEFIPHSRTWFWSFESFIEKVENFGMSKSLPDSADNTNYYFFEGYFIDRAGYYTELSDEDYKLMKVDSLLRFIDSFQIRFSTDFYLCDMDDKRTVEPSELEENGIDFWEKLIPKSENITDYYYLVYESKNGGSFVSYNVIICNDSTNSIMEFAYRRPIE